MKSRFLQSFELNPKILTVGLCLSVGFASFSQTESVETLKPESIPLKYRTEISEDQKIRSTGERSDTYFILHFKEQLASIENLIDLGITPLNYINSSSIYAHIPESVNLEELTDFNWGTSLQASDKIQEQLYTNFSRSETTPVLIYLPSNLTAFQINTFKEGIALETIAHESLPKHILLAYITRDKMFEVANDNYVSWILEAPSRAIAGDRFHFCLGAMTPYGPHAEFSTSERYVLQGSDWDGPGLGCADLTYHFENGTPDIAGTAEWTTVRNAMDEWKNYAGLTFTETGTVGLANSIDIAWESGDHGDGSAFDGPSGTLAHAFYPQYGGELHFDEAENWTTTGGGIDLYAVAVHELGHALGLNHSDNGSAVMAPFYAGTITGLHSDDIAGIQALYSSTPCGGALYCASKGNSTADEWINTITVAGNTNASGNNSGYADFTSLSPIALSVGASNSLSLSPAYTGTVYTEYWRVWIDYNKNNIFDASELVYSGTGTTTKTGSFTVPSGLTGTTRMRISMKYGSYPTPCETFSYGEVEDYTVSFSTPAPTYCTTKGSSTADEWIKKVTLGGYFHASGNDGGYKDNTALAFPLTTGSVAVSFEPDFAGTTYTEYWRVWIDLNSNGVFDGSELLFSGSGTSTVSGSMTIPSGYAGLTTRIRVSMKYGSYSSPCETFSYGEVEDFMVTFSAPTIVDDKVSVTDDFLIYPNPIETDLLYIQSGFEQPNYQIFDGSGSIVASGVLTGNSIDIANLAVGHYMVRLVSDETSITKSFIRR